MTEKKGVQFEGKETYVKSVFGEISKVYDTVNNIMTFGMVKGWQKFMIKKANAKAGSNTLDVGTGTGEIAFLLAQTVGSTGKVTAVDLTAGMLEVAKVKAEEKNLPLVIDFVEGSVLELPFADETFDCVTSGFMLRNVTDLDTAISELARVTKKGGKVVCLEIAEPDNPLFKWGFRIHFGKIVPFIGSFFDKGRSIQGKQPAYTWLRDSFNGFPYGNDMIDIYKKAGLLDSKYYNKCLGSVNIYEGTK